VSSYHDGRRIEYAVIHALTEAGWECTRAASSKGSADVVAIRAGTVALVNVKRTTPPGPAERAELLRIADLIPTVSAPIVALGPASRLTWRLLTGPDASHYLPWSPE
jgi:hypothetical protein